MMGKILDFLLHRKMEKNKIETERAALQDINALLFELAYEDKEELVRETLEGRRAVVTKDMDTFMVEITVQLYPK